MEQKEKLFKCKIEAGILKEATKAISTLSNEFKFKVTRDGLTIRVVDPAHLAMLELNIKKEATEEYVYVDDLEIGIDTDKLNSTIKTAKKGDMVKLVYNEECNTLDITVGIITRSIGLIDTEGMPDPKIPNLELPVQAVIKSQDLNNAVKACSNVSDRLKFSADNNKFTIFAEGDPGKVNVELDKDLLKELMCYGQFKSFFSIDYLYTMVKCIDKKGFVTLKIGDDNPLQLEFKINPWIDVLYLLAPRIKAE